MAYSIEKVEKLDGFVTFMENIIEQLKDCIYADTILLKCKGPVSKDKYREVKSITPVYDDETGKVTIIKVECVLEEGDEIPYIKSYPIGLLYQLLEDLISTEASSEELEACKN